MVSEFSATVSRHPADRMTLNFPVSMPKTQDWLVMFIPPLPPKLIESINF